jgi:hypothetical protein
VTKNILPAKIPITKEKPKATKSKPPSRLRKKEKNMEWFVAQRPFVKADIKARPPFFINNIAGKPVAKSVHCEIN